MNDWNIEGRWLNSIVVWCKHKCGTASIDLIIYLFITFVLIDITQIEISNRGYSQYHKLHPSNCSYYLSMICLLLIFELLNYQNPIKISLSEAVLPACLSFEEFFTNLWNFKRNLIHRLSLSISFYILMKTAQTLFYHM